MSWTLAWLLLAVVAVTAEVALPVFAFLLVAGAAAVCAGAAALGMPLIGQLLLFSVTVMGLLTQVRPRLMLRFGRSTQRLPSRTERLLGQRGRLTEAIDPTRGTGRVQVGGEDWAARSIAPVPAGTEVVIEEADGIVLLVSPSE